MRQIISQQDIERLQDTLIGKEMAAVPPGDHFRDGSPTTPEAHDSSDLSELRTQVRAGRDTYTDRLLKYIPTEVIALYLTLLGILGASSHHDSKQFGWIIFVFCLVGTPLYLWKITKVSKVAQLGLSSAGFAVWAFSLGTPFSLYTWYDPLYPALILPAYTFLVPMIDV